MRTDTPSQSRLCRLSSAARLRICFLPPVPLPTRLGRGPSSATIRSVFILHPQAPDAVLGGRTPPAGAPGPEENCTRGGSGPRGPGPRAPGVGGVPVTALLPPGATKGACTCGERNWFQAEAQGASPENEKFRRAGTLSQRPRESPWPPRSRRHFTGVTSSLIGNIEKWKTETK